MARITLEMPDDQTETVEGTIHGPWAIHRVIRVNVQHRRYQITNVATGRSFLNCHGTTRKQIAALLKELQASKLDWTLANGLSDLTPEHKVEGRRLRAKYNNPITIDEEES